MQRLATAYKNVTKNLTSYEGRRAAVRLIGIAVIIVGLVVGVALVFTGNSVMPLLFSLPFVLAGVLLLYVDYKHATAIKAIENYR